MSGHDYDIIYKKGKENVVVDALSWKSEEESCLFNLSVLVAFLVLGTRVFKSARCRSSARAQHEKISFQASKRVSRRNYIIDDPDSSIRADRWMAGNRG
jgi:hypothetical protein